MIAKNVTPKEMRTALDILNIKYNNNIIFNRFNVKNLCIHFTLKVRDSKALGHRIGIMDHNNKQRRLACACWHAHGDFFEALLSINDKAVIKSMISTIDKDGGNWEDQKMGSRRNPVYLSELCECER